MDKQTIAATKTAFFKLVTPLLKRQWFYLLGMFSTLAIWHLSIIINNPIENNDTIFYTLYWGSILYLFWENRYQENSPSWFSSWLGLGLLLIVICRPFHLWQDLILFRLAPIVAGIGVGLLSFGFSGFKKHWRLFVILCLMLFPFNNLNGIFDHHLHFNELTASTSAILMHYVGFNAIPYGDLLKVPTGQVKVLYPCTGGTLIVWLIKLTALITVIIFPLTWRQKFSLVISAISVGFLTGCIRVGLLVLLVNDHKLFHFWHDETGGSIFITLSTIAYAILCNWILPSEYSFLNPDKSDNTQIIQPKRRLFLLGTWGMIILTGIYVMVTKKPMSNASILPDQLLLNNWQQIKVTALPSAKIAPENKKFIIQSAKNYSYIQENQQLELQTFYILNSRGGENPFLASKTLYERLDIQKKFEYSPEIGYYILYENSQQAYLTSCINVRGGSTVNTNQFMQNRYKYDLSSHRILPWIFGQDVLRDDRCLWVQLSLPLNGVSASSIYPVLKSIWIKNYPQWQSLLLSK